MFRKVEEQVVKERQAGTPGRVSVPSRDLNPIIRIEVPEKICREPLRTCKLLTGRQLNYFEWDLIARVTALCRATRNRLPDDHFVDTH